MGTAREPGDLKRCGALPGNVQHRLPIPIAHLIGGPVEEVIRGSSIEIDMEMRSNALTTDRKMLDCKRNEDRP